MNFIKILICNFSLDKNKLKSEEFEEKLLILENEINNLKENFSLEINDNQIIIFNEKFLNNEKISFWDFIEVGKILKNFLIENNLANLENYKTFFKIETKNLEEKKEISIDKLDSLIAKVDKNDPKLLEVLAKIDKIKNKN